MHLWKGLFLFLCPSCIQKADPTVDQQAAKLSKFNRKPERLVRGTGFYRCVWMRYWSLISVRPWSSNQYFIWRGSETAIKKISTEPIKNQRNWFLWNKQLSAGRKDCVFSLSLNSLISSPMSLKKKVHGFSISMYPYARYMLKTPMGHKSGTFKWHINQINKTDNALSVSIQRLCFTEIYQCLNGICFSRSILRLSYPAWVVFRSMALFLTVLEHSRWYFSSVYVCLFLTTLLSCCSYWCFLFWACEWVSYNQNKQINYIADFKQQQSI